MLIGFKAQNHRQQVDKRGALEKVDDRRTPRDLWDPWNREFKFTLDAAASSDNAPFRMRPCHLAQRMDTSVTARSLAAILTLTAAGLLAGLAALFGAGKEWR